MKLALKLVFISTYICFCSNLDDIGFQGNKNYMHYAIEKNCPNNDFTNGAL